MTAEALQASYAEALERPGLLDHEHGEPPQGTGVQIISREFEQPFLAHACMEPLNCTVQLGTDRARVWVGTHAEYDRLISR